MNQNNDEENNENNSRILRGDAAKQAEANEDVIDLTDEEEDWMTDDSSSLKSFEDMTPEELVDELGNDDAKQILESLGKDPSVID